MSTRATFYSCTQISGWTLQYALVVQVFDPPRYVLVSTFLTILLVGRPLMTQYGGLTVNNSKDGGAKRSWHNLRQSSDIPLERMRKITPGYRCSRRRFNPRTCRYVRSVIARDTLLGSNTLSEWLTSRACNVSPWVVTDLQLTIQADMRVLDSNL